MTIQPTTYFTVWNQRGTFIQSGHVINAFTAKSAIEIFFEKYNYSMFTSLDGLTESTLENFNIKNIFYVVLMNENNTAFNKSEEEIRKVATKFNVKSKIVVQHDIQEDRTEQNKKYDQELIDYYKSIGYSDDDIRKLNIVGEKGE